MTTMDSTTAPPQSPATPDALWRRVNDLEAACALLAEENARLRAVEAERDEARGQTRENLADYAHEAWSGWMNYLLSKSTVNPDGTWTVPAWAAERWYRQMTTPYHLLPESEKDSDRAEADKILAIVGGAAASEARLRAAIAEALRLRAGGVIGEAWATLEQGVKP